MARYPLYLPLDPVPRLCDRRRGRGLLLQGLQPDRSDRKRRELQVRAMGITRSNMQLKDEFDYGGEVVSCLGESFTNIVHRSHCPKGNLQKNMKYQCPSILLHLFCTNPFLASKPTYLPIPGNTHMGVNPSCYNKYSTAC